MNLFAEMTGSVVAEGGRPAGCLPFDGLPSYEQDDGLLLFDMLIPVVDRRGGRPRLYPCSYWNVTRFVPEGLVRGKWRPCIYTRRVDHNGGYWQHEGSQGELEHRYCMNWAARNEERGDPWTVSEAEQRAHELLREMLTPHQRIQLAACEGFACRGGLTGNLYWIKLGNGFYIIDKRTHQTTISYCFHPEYWLPDEDIALSTKLQLEDPALEPRVLEVGKMTPVEGYLRAPTRAEMYAYGAEKELIL